MRLPVLGWKEVAKILVELGYQTSRTRGDHMNFVKHGCKTVTVQMKKELSDGNLLSIIRSTGLTKDEFLEHLK